MNENYVFWDVDSTDWNGVYDQYQSLFSQLDLNKKADVGTAARYFQEITKNIRDGHYFIDFTHPTIANSDVYPIQNRKEAMGLLNSAFPYFLKDSTYLDPGFQIATHDGFRFNNEALTVVTGEINGEILYFSSNFFKLSEAYYSENGESVKATLDYFFQWLTESQQRRKKGIIIDVRNNPGGDLSDLNFLLGKLVDQPLHIGYCQYKNGDKPDELTPAIKAFVNPAPEVRAVDLPVVILGDNYSASLSELAISTVRALDDGLFIGETTWGSLGAVVPYEVYASGSFDIENFMRLQLSSCKFTSLDGNIYEGSGLIPDVYVPHSAEAYSAGIDPQLEAAISSFN
ncbi:MAG: hypothetical protein Roseis2KO_54960 [Roseivirga sp.]